MLTEEHQAFGSFTVTRSAVRVESYTEHVIIRAGDASLWLVGADAARELGLELVTAAIRLEAELAQAAASAAASDEEQVRYTVWDTEVYPPALVGDYLETDEAGVNYRRPDGSTGFAPVDCVEVRPEPAEVTA